MDKAKRLSKEQQAVLYASLRRIDRLFDVPVEWVLDDVPTARGLRESDLHEANIEGPLTMEIRFPWDTEELRMSEDGKVWAPEIVGRATVNVKDTIRRLGISDYAELRCIQITVHMAVIPEVGVLTLEYRMLLEAQQEDDDAVSQLSVNVEDPKTKCVLRTMSHKEELTRDIAEVLNRHCIENDSDTPDFILAGYLVDCLLAVAPAIRGRDNWYGLRPSPGGGARRTR